MAKSIRPGAIPQNSRLLEQLRILTVENLEQSLDDRLTSRVQPMNPLFLLGHHFN
jgi:hypothetical protein